MTHSENTTEVSHSYVEGEADADSGTRNPADGSEEQQAKQGLREAWIKLMLSADLVLGILLGHFLRVRTDQDYAAWQKVKSLNKDIGSLEFERHSLVSMVEVAHQNCMAGILRALHTPKKKHIPYFRSLPLLIAVVLAADAGQAQQQVSHQEGILIDVSGSVGAGGASNELFREYLQGAKKQLETEPAGTRVIVAVISTDSFGSVRELLKGRTPSQNGVFTDELNRARRQLVAGFVDKTRSLTPIASGTDIVGGLWHIKTLFESGDTKQGAVTRDIWIYSDMMNETPALPMPALLATGPRGMLEHARTNGFIVPLKGYRIHVVGASTRGLTPQAWNNIKEFWQDYFHDAGAELVCYTPDITAER